MPDSGKYLAKGETMLTAVQDGLMRLTDFKGRSTRAQFWYFFLFLILVQGICYFVFSEEVYNVLTVLFFIPELIIGIRRMHDIGKSGWYYWIPIYGLILCTQKSKEISSVPLDDLEEEIEVDDTFLVDQEEESTALTIKSTNPASTLSRINLTLTLLTLVLVGAGAYYGWGPVMQFRNSDPMLDGYVQPRSIVNLVKLVQQSTVTIYCDFGTGDIYDQGTGWAMDIETDRQSEYPTALVTNHHVIENCMDGKGKIFVAAIGGKEFPAIIDNWDLENDLAVVATKLKLKPLQLSRNHPYAGYWVMALGTADGYEGSVSFGNVLNTTESEVFITAAISHGNSGGPLVDNEGKVIGTNSWSKIGEQYNGAKSMDAMCWVIMKCDRKTFWDWGD